MKEPLFLPLVLCALLASLPAPAAAEPAPDPLALNYHLMHPGGESKPGDPNAAFHLDGTYHLHYILSHPWTVDGKERKGFSFVHVTSPDMLHWTWHPTKLQPAFTGHGMFSGTGFVTKDGRPAAIYHGQASGRNQIAIARDRRLSAWEKPYPLEPVTPDGEPAEIKHWDPDCFRIGEFYYAFSGGRNPPLLKSSDLRNWVHIGDFFSHEPDGVVIGEDVSCGNFFPVGDPVGGKEKWMLLCISHPYGCRYYLGDWDAEAEQFVPETHGRMNWRSESQDPDSPKEYRDFFAPESVLTEDGRRVMWAWLTTLGENALRSESVLSLPRELSLREDGGLRIEPIRELKTLRHGLAIHKNIEIAPKYRTAGGEAATRIARLDGDACEIRITIDREQAARKRFGFRLFTDEERMGIPIYFQPNNGTLRVDATEAPFAVSDLPEGEDVELRIFVDKYLVEVFVNGRQAMVAAEMEWRDAGGFDAYAWGAPITIKTVEIWKMKPANRGYHEAKKSGIWQPDGGTPSAPPAKREAAVPAAPASGGVRPPNFVVIFVDDLGYADIQPFSDRYETPNLARMAAEGRTYSSFYVASSVCTPSRAALMTGCYPARIDMLHNDLEMDTPNHGVLWPGDRKGLHPEEITIAEVLKERGYATACIGKWHLGDQPPFLPTRQGFDRYFGIPFSNDMGSRKSMQALPLVRDERMIEELAPASEGGQDFLTKRYTEEALRFLEEKSGHPFFLYLPHSMVHGPHAASPAFRGSTGRGLYADAIAEVDWSVGQVLDKLRELGVAKNTLVLFTSDNGGGYRPERNVTRSSNFPYSGGKGSPAEGGFRVPTIAWWPGTIPAGTSTGQMASTVDLLPTLAALSGKPHRPNPGRPIDGLDLSILFRGPAGKKSPRDSFVYYTDNLADEGAARQPRRLTAVRLGKWKYYLEESRFPAAGDGEMLTIPEGALFNLETDVSERANIAAEFPGVVNRLRVFAGEVVADLGEFVGGGSGFRPAGFVDEDEAKPINERVNAGRNRE